MGAGVTRFPAHQRVASYPLDHGSLVRRDGFEPPWPLRAPDLQSGAFVRSATDARVPCGIRTRKSSGHSRVPQPLGSRHQCSVTGSNRRPLRCGRSALPAELTERAPRRTRTSNDGFVVRHDLRFTRGAWSLVPARGNEPRPLPCRGSALPLSYAGVRDADRPGGLALHTG